MARPMLWPEGPTEWVVVEAMSGWVMMRTFCKRHHTAVCPCDFRLGIPADDILQAVEAEEVDELTRLETEDADIAAVLPW